MAELAEAAQQVLNQYFTGILSTHSVEYPGYPFGSVVPFCLDESGQPLILISALAQHTRNIIANPKVALTLLDNLDAKLYSFHQQMKDDPNVESAWTMYNPQIGRKLYKGSQG